MVFTFHTAADKYLMDNREDMYELERAVCNGVVLCGEMSSVSGRHNGWPNMPYKAPNTYSRECWRFDDHLRELYRELDGKLYGEEEASE